MRLKWVGPYVTLRRISVDDWHEAGVQDQGAIEVNPRLGEQALYVEVTDAAAEVLLRSEAENWQRADDVPGEAIVVGLTEEGDVDDETEPDAPASKKK